MRTKIKLNYSSPTIKSAKRTKHAQEKGIVVKPILTRDFNTRDQVDLIDMQSSQQGQFKWIFFTNATSRNVWSLGHLLRKERPKSPTNY
ncbi:hypothetical protein DPMN_092214 [Dreissena polymorpha]|uniref:Uncharacterized protein n=1 Tax=Dreissena polymorpha TaxID=45954 RepID=A0A9D4R1G3_DREPO|nr:hypothetical protein DPMN_092214 [Dreissena polymorpha]